MSNRVLYDPLVVHYLAAELDAELRGRTCAAAPSFAPDLSVTLPFGGDLELRADLHPTRGWITLRDSPGASEDEELDAVCERVHVPPDERVLCFELQLTRRFREPRRTLILELPTNQWNAVLVDGSGSIVNVLRGRRAGARSLFPGAEYAPPPAEPRCGVEAVERAAAYERWIDAIEAADPAERRARLIAGFAWTGALNADWILGAATASERFERWWWLRGLPPRDPVLLRSGHGWQPYPLRLEGVDAEPRPSLLDAMERLADAEPAAGEARGPATSGAEAWLRHRMAATQRRIQSLREEMAALGDGERLRALGDLLLARIHDIPRGADRVELEDFDGTLQPIELDPTLTPAENAARLYDEARREERAAARIPALLEEAEAHLARLDAASEAVRSGEVPDWVEAEMARRVERREGAGQVPAALPYRRFRTSGGLEVLVGRGAKENDRLTFGDSSPDDVWLHARSVPGSHVILRWPDPKGAPPARDLTEAAQLAAVFSRARTSGTVAVDWTRRKHVRKPRGAAPGAVIPQRVKTLFVEPDESVVERLSGGLLGGEAAPRGHRPL